MAPFSLEIFTDARVLATNHKEWMTHQPNTGNTHQETHDTSTRYWQDTLRNTWNINQILATYTKKHLTHQSDTGNTHQKTHDTSTKKHLHQHTHQWHHQSPTPFLLDVKQSDVIRLLQQQTACASVVDSLAVGRLHLLCDLILQVLDDDLTKHQQHKGHQSHSSGSWENTNMQNISTACYNTIVKWSGQERRCWTAMELQVQISASVYPSSFFFSFFCASLFLAGNSGPLPWVRHSSCKSSTTHSYQCLQFSCVQTMLWLPALGIFNVHTHVEVCKCTGGGGRGGGERLYGHQQSLHWKLTLGEKSLATPGIQTHISTVPWHSTNWAPPALHHPLLLTVAEKRPI